MVLSPVLKLMGTVLLLRAIHNPFNFICFRLIFAVFTLLLFLITRSSSSNKSIYVTLCRYDFTIFQLPSQQF